MADAKKCDLCGEFYDVYNVVRKVYHTIDGYNQSVNVDTRAYKKGGDALDLCKNCAISTMEAVTKDLTTEE